MSPQTIVTLIGLLSGIIGSFLLFTNSPSPSPFGEVPTERGTRALVPRDPTDRIRERTRAKLGFLFLLIGFVCQAVAVGLPIIAQSPKPPLEKETSQPPKEPVVYQNRPSATELFTLRSKCVQLGEKLLNDYPVGSALNQTQTAHYDVNSGRCYVLVTVQTADTTVPINAYQVRRYLFDGQTGELLADQSKDSKGKGGIVYNKGILGFEKTGEYIDKIMSEN